MPSDVFLRVIILDKFRKKQLKKFASSIKIHFENLKLLDQAFYHSSYINESSEICEDNEKLEFLGDSVLALVTVEYLYLKYPGKTEGELSRLKSLLVSSTALFQFASQIKLSDYLLLGKGEEQSGGKKRMSLLADTFEALLGAIYLDGGLKPARKFIIPLLEDYLSKIERQEHVRDYKTCFQLYVQQKFKTVPIYKTVKESGPDHAKIFFVEVLINSEICGKGKGKSKKNAQQAAAKEAIKKLGFE
jgi:ribonuclease-3